MTLEIQAAEPLKVKLSDIVIDTSILLRPVDEDTARDYADQIKAGAKLPPISVMRLPDGSLLCYDGQHRHRAFQLLKRDSIPCDVRDGTLLDARLASAGSNCEHGKSRDADMKKRAVLMLRAQPEWADASARWLAEKCSVSPNFVLGILKAQATAHGEQLPPSKGKDGKIRKAPKKPKAKGANVARKLKSLAHTIDVLAKKWPKDQPLAELITLLLDRAAELEKRSTPATAAE